MVKAENQLNPSDVELPKSIIESFARFLVPEIRKYYDSDQGQQAFADCQEAQEKIKKN